jgi:hypothetical protein
MILCQVNWEFKPSSNIKKTAGKTQIFYFSSGSKENAKQLTGTKWKSFTFYSHCCLFIKETFLDLQLSEIEQN